MHQDLLDRLHRGVLQGGLGSYPSDDRLSDVQSIASVRSSGADTPKHNTFGDDNNTSNVLVKQEPPGEQLTNSEKTSTTGDEGNGTGSNQPGENKDTN